MGLNPGNMGGQTFCPNAKSITPGSFEGLADILGFGGNDVAEMHGEVLSSFWRN